MKVLEGIFILLLPSAVICQTQTKLFLYQYDETSWIHMPSIQENGNGTTCSPPPNPPLGSSVVNAAVIDGSISLCGGYYSTYCFRLSKALNLWFEFPALDVARVYAASAMTSFGWWISGGGSEGIHSQSSTSLWDGSAWMAGPDIPSERNGHCMVQVDSSLTFIAGGFSVSDGGYLSDAYMYDWTADSWTALPNMTAAMSGLACTLYQDSMAGAFILAAGNQRQGIAGNSSLLSLDLSNPQEWQVLPDIPVESETFVGVFVRDGNDLVLANRFQGQLLRFSENDQTFRVIQDQTLPIVGYDVAVLAVDDNSLYGCG